MEDIELNIAADPARVDVEKLRSLLPELGLGSLRTATAGTPRRGKILKVRLGFNPNSSSVGTTVVVFLWSLVASGAVMALTSAVLAHRFRPRRADHESPSTTAKVDSAI